MTDFNVLSTQPVDDWKKYPLYVGINEEGKRYGFNHIYTHSGIILARKLNQGEEFQTFFEENRKIGADRFTSSITLRTSTSPSQIVVDTILQALKGDTLYGAKVISIETFPANLSYKEIPFFRVNEGALDKYIEILANVSLYSEYLQWLDDPII